MVQKRIYLLFAFLSMVMKAHGASDANKKDTIKSVLALTYVGVEEAFNKNGPLIVSSMKKDMVSNTPILLESEKQTPESYVESCESELFSSQEWDAFLQKLLKHSWLQLYDRLSKADRQQKGKNEAEEEPVNEMIAGFCVKLVERFYIPNYKVMLVDNLYSYGITKEELSLAREVLAEWDEKDFE